MRIHMTISGEFITEQVQAFMREGEYLRAFRIASSLSQHDMTDSERIELALGLMYGATILETNEDGSLNVVPTNIDINLADALAETQRLIGREYERLTNRKNDMANKIVADLLKADHVYMQDETLRA